MDSGLALEIATDLTTEIGPRLYGSEDERRAVDWATERFREYGFDKIWTESFPVDRGWERGKETAAVTFPAPQNLVVTALGGSVATPPEGIEAEIALFKSIEALESQPPGSLKERSLSSLNQWGSGNMERSQVRSEEMDLQKQPNAGP